MGIVVPRRMGCAVERNKFKRRVRVCFDNLRLNVPFAFDLLVLALEPTAIKLPFKVLKEILFRRVHQAGMLVNAISNHEKNNCRLHF